MATTKLFTTAGNADDTRKGEEEKPASYEDKENPFSLLVQPPSTFSPRPLEDIAQLSSGPSPVDNGPSIGSSGHSLASSGFANYRTQFPSQPVHEPALMTLSLAREQPVSNQSTQCDIPGMAWLFCIPCVHFITGQKFCGICVTNLSLCMVICLVFALSDMPNCAVVLCGSI